MQKKIAHDKLINVLYLSSISWIFMTLCLFEVLGELCSFLDNIKSNWSERSAWAARALFQTGCMANVVATINTVIGPSEVRALHMRRCRQAVWQT